MLGYSEMREVMLWVQTTKSAKVQIQYWEIDKPKILHKTQVVETQKESGFTAHLLADEVEPSMKYAYKLLINNKLVPISYKLEFKTPPLWRYRSEPEKVPQFKIALGSCAFINEEKYDRIGKGYGGDYGIFQSIAKQNPEIMLWLGDNMYLREADSYSKTRIYYRYTHSRSLPEMRELLASSINLAIWDDHDYGPNDSDKTFTKKDISLQAFKDFWANPSYGIDNQGGITSFYEYGDCQFFLIDDRYFRSADNLKTAPREMLGQKQMDWLIESLAGSQATFKFVCIGGQVLNSVPIYETLSNVSPNEYTQLWARLDSEKIKNVIFLTGDRHHTELTARESKSGIKVYDWTVSPFTSGVAKAPNENNIYRVPNSYIEARNFGLIEVSGEKNQRVLNLKCLGVNGEELWKYEIKAQ
jgi:alkaline phosphatase D